MYTAYMFMDRRSTTNLLGALTIALHDRMSESLQESLGLGRSAVAALLSIGTRPGTSVGDLAIVIGKEQSSTVRIVARLEEENLVSRFTAADDARRLELHLTKRGRQKYRRLLEERHEILNPVLESLAERDRKTLHRLLDQMLASIPSSPDEARTICRLCDHGVCRGAACPAGRPFGEATP